jgi:hypothetical protein
MNKFSRPQLNFILMTAIFMFYFFSCLNSHQAIVKKIPDPFSLLYINKTPPDSESNITGLSLKSRDNGVKLASIL